MDLRKDLKILGISGFQVRQSMGLHSGNEVGIDEDPLSVRLHCRSHPGTN